MRLRLRLRPEFSLKASLLHLVSLFALEARTYETENKRAFVHRMTIHLHSRPISVHILELQARAPRLSSPNPTP